MSKKEIRTVDFIVIKEDLLSAINRFYPDGMIAWPKAELQKVLSIEIDLEHPAIIPIFFDWQRLGFIDFIGTEEEFVRVKKTIPK